MWPFRRRTPEAPPPAGVLATPPSEGRRLISFLQPREVAALGSLPFEAVIAHAEADDPFLKAAQPNGAFVEFLHATLAEAGPRDPGLRAAAAREEEGWVYIIDLRTPEGPQGRVPSEDIIGGFQVRGGCVVAGSYWANDRHAVVSANGPLQLPESLRRALVEAVGRLGRA